MGAHVGDYGAVFEDGDGGEEDEGFLEGCGGEGVESVCESVEREGGGWDGWEGRFGWGGG